MKTISIILTAAFLGGCALAPLVPIAVGAYGVYQDAKPVIKEIKRIRTHGRDK